MVFQIAVFIYTIVYAATLELAAAVPFSSFFWAGLVAYLAIMSAKKLSNDWLWVITPAIYSISSFALLLLIDSNVERQTFIFLSACMYYLLMLSVYRIKIYRKDQTARGIFAAAIAATAFFFFASTYGIFLNFDIPLWFLTAVYLAVVSGFTFSYYSILDINRPKIVALYSLVAGLGMAEIVTVLSFWPFGYLTTGVVALIFYYILWDVGQMYFLSALSKKRLVANVVFFGILIVIILYTSRWMPAV